MLVLDLDMADLMWGTDGLTVEDFGLDLVFAGDGYVCLCVSHKADTEDQQTEKENQSLSHGATPFLCVVACFAFGLYHVRPLDLCQ